MVAVGLLLLAFASAFPEYCSKVEDEEDRSRFEHARTVPQLSVEASQRDLSLLHASVLIRHGARTPADRYGCWKGYQPHWDCDVEESVKPVLPNELKGTAFGQKNKLSEHKGDPPPLVGFRKVYDVRPDGNELGGTCGMGHLLAEGYLQHSIMGKLFADYYQSLRSPLVSAEQTHAQDVANSIWFRSSDLQRTLLSGSTFMDSFLTAAGLSLKNDEMPIHTMDEAADVIFPNFRVCPGLATLKDELFASGTFAEIEKKYTATRDEVGKFADVTSWPGEFYDCLMTSLCAHGEESLSAAFPNVNVPKLIDDTLKAVDEYATFQFTTQDGIYSKTASVQFMVEFKTQVIRLLVADITKRLGGEDPAMAARMLAKVVPMDDLHEFYSILLKQKEIDFPFRAPRLILYSGHDTSILQFLGSLGEGAFFNKWPPYASQVIFEIYSQEDTYYFRLIYNGSVITDIIPDCADKSLPRDICSLSSFFQATNWAIPSKIADYCVPDPI